jgi:pre-rRNA-processing protein TSR3
MNTFPPTLIWRHRRENKKKCSLRGLESREQFHFFSYPQQMLPELEGYIVLALDAPELTPADKECGLLILDATWRHAESMLKRVQAMAGPIYRSIPSHYRTAYPRRQEDCEDPNRGLASLEAIYIAYQILGRDTSGLLDNYYWKEPFLNALRR